MRRHIENHRLAPRQRVHLPARNQFVVRISPAREGDESLAHLIGHLLRLRTEGRRAGLVDVVEHQLNVGRVRRAELAAISRRGPVKLISVCGRARLRSLFSFDYRGSPRSSRSGRGKKDIARRIVRIELSIFRNHNFRLNIDAQVRGKPLRDLLPSQRKVRRVAAEKRARLVMSVADDHGNVRRLWRRVGIKWMSRQRAFVEHRRKRNRSKRQHGIAHVDGFEQAHRRNRAQFRGALRRQLQRIKHRASSQRCIQWT